MTFGRVLLLTVVLNNELDAPTLVGATNKLKPSPTVQKLGLPASDRELVARRNIAPLA